MSRPGQPHRGANVRPPGLSLLAGVILLCSVILPGSGSSSLAGHDRRGCEPAAPVGLHARVVSIHEKGDRAMALIEVIADPLVSVPDARLRGATGRPAGLRAAPELPERELPLFAGLRRRVLHEVELPTGRDHDLYFVLESDSSPELLPGATAHVRVALAPGSRPRLRAGALEFRARMEGE